MSTMIRDSMTGLLNHTAIEEQLVRELSLQRRQNGMLSYAYGHAMGDQVLRKTGGGLKRLTETDPRLSEALDRLVAPLTRGDPQSPPALSLQKHAPSRSNVVAIIVSFYLRQCLTRPLWTHTF